MGFCGFLGLIGRYRVDRINEGHKLSRVIGLIRGSRGFQVQALRFRI